MKNKYRIAGLPGAYQGSRWYFLEKSLERKDTFTTIGGFIDEDLAIKVCKFLNEQEFDIINFLSQDTAEKI